LRKFIMAAAAVATLAMPTAALANASAANKAAGGNTGGGAGVTETGWVGTAQGNSQQFSASYTDPTFGGPLTCTGVHLKKQNQDSFTCTAAKGVTLNNLWVGEKVSWNSDMYGVGDPDSRLLNGSMTVQSLITNTAGQVTGYNGLASYNG
jgi:hypothetical protein